jgi:hypothetical protein
LTRQTAVLLAVEEASAKNFELRRLSASRSLCFTNCSRQKADDPTKRGMLGCCGKSSRSLFQKIYTNIHFWNGGGRQKKLTNQALDDVRFCKKITMVNFLDCFG